ncbi:CNNM domain-containing protein [uncultured Helicobacter sp.]|uniref:CNNM domain-containing protein n=1 Tax=uncultured Helicobacter sp. TaxID=175537 RepID=UPI002628CBE7|nr:CNNM domain-containing protein [uncultured Helicobacter sp.]
MFSLIGYFLLAIIISFICSVLEAALLSVTPPFMESYAKTHLKSGKILKYLKSNIDNAVGAILVVNTFANTVGAAGVGAQAVEIFGEAWQGFVALFMTLCILYLSEILPKTIGATYWKMIVSPMSYCVLVLYCITFPFVYISRIITHLFKRKDVDQMSRDEILAIMDLGEKSGSINELEGDILEHLILQKTLQTKDIMTPKEKIFALNEGISIEESVRVSSVYKYSRIPLYTDTIDKINSIVFKRNILQANLEKRGKEALKSIAKNIIKVESEMGLLDLLEKFILQKEHLFLVIDGKQNIVGIVALEDVINAALGVGNLQHR